MIVHRVQYPPGQYLPVNQKMFSVLCECSPQFTFDLRETIILSRKQRMQKEKIDFLMALNEKICTLSMNPQLAKIQQIILDKLQDHHQPSNGQTRDSTRHSNNQQFLNIKVLKCV